MIFKASMTNEQNFLYPQTINLILYNIFSLKLSEKTYLYFKVYLIGQRI